MRHYHPMTGRADERKAIAARASRGDQRTPRMLIEQLDTPPPRRTQSLSDDAAARRPNGIISQFSRARRPPAVVFDPLGDVCCDGQIELSSIPAADLTWRSAVCAVIRRGFRAWNAVAQAWPWRACGAAGPACAQVRASPAANADDRNSADEWVAVRPGPEGAALGSRIDHEGGRKPPPEVAEADRRMGHRTGGHSDQVNEDRRKARASNGWQGIRVNFPPSRDWRALAHTNGLFRRWP